MNKIMTLCMPRLLQLKNLLPIQISFQRRLASSTPEKTTEMIKILRERFPLAKDVQVVDVSGGCGAMYEVLVESSEFKGMSIVKQHRLINETLKEQIKEMHGLRIHTMLPKQEKT